MLYQYLLDDVNRKPLKPGSGTGDRASRHVVEYVENRRPGGEALSPKDRDALIRTRSTKQASVRNSSARWAQGTGGEEIAMKTVTRHRRDESLQSMTRPEMKIGFALGGDETESKTGRRLSF